MISDHDLCLAAQTGDIQAADLLVRRHARIAYAIANDFGIPGADHDDTRQEALLALYVAIISYRAGKGASFVTFANHVIRMRLRTAVKAGDRLKHRQLSEALRTVALDDRVVDATELAVDHDADPARIVEQREQLSLLVESTRALTPLERHALLGIASGRTYPALAAAHAVSAKAIDNGAQRARVKLRAILAAAE